MTTRKNKLWATVLAVGALLGLTKTSIDLYTYLNNRPRVLEQRELDARTAEAKAVIKCLFRCWETKDLDTYMSLWEEKGIQVSDKYFRSRSAIKEKRTLDFKKYKRVWVRELRIEVPEPNLKEVDIFIVFTMSFIPVDPKAASFVEAEVRERYTLKWHDELHTWRIKLNIAYLRGMPDGPVAMEKVQVPAMVPKQ